MQRKGNREDAFKGETIMKRISALAFLAAALISMSSVCAHAQVVEFNVPFDFTVSHQVLPAGTYRVSYAAKNDILIRSQDGRFNAISLTFATNGEPTGGSKVVFTRYGNQYFLHQVLFHNADMNDELPISRLEQRVRLQRVQPPKSETVAALEIRTK
jgi:hypothetical protein